jgi:hypothetical protein
MIDGGNVAVHVDKPVGSGIAIEEPNDVPRLWLGRGSRSDIYLGVTRVIRGADVGIRCEMAAKVPQSVKVAVEINAYTTCIEIRAHPAPVLPPHRINGLTVVSAIRINTGEEYDLKPLNHALDVVGRESLPAVA